MLQCWSPAFQISQATCSEQVEKQRASWVQLHAELLAATPGTSITLDDLTWALQCVRSRAFSGPYGGADTVKFAFTCHPVYLRWLSGKNVHPRNSGNLFYKCSAHGEMCGLSCC